MPCHALPVPESPQNAGKFGAIVGVKRFVFVRVEENDSSISGKLRAIRRYTQR